MSISRIAFILSLPGLMTAIQNVCAEDITSQQSAWSPAPVEADAGLRDPVLRRGQEVFQARCQICHGTIPKDVVPGGIPPMPGTQALQIRYKGAKPAMLEQRTDLTPEFVRAIVRNGINSMPSFRPTEVTNSDLDVLGAYLSRGKR